MYPLPDRPPDTKITSSPADNAITDYRVELSWTGNDPDGEVDHFQWRISDNGPDGMLDLADTLGLRWNSTTAWDSTFVVSADLDTIVADPTGPILGRRSHTFFVRAVDQEGAVDPTPAQVSFTAITWTPEIHFDLPIDGSGNACFQSSTTLSFGWEGSDDDAPQGRPVQCRYALVDVSQLDPVKLADAGLAPIPAGTCLTDQEVRELNPVSFFPDDAWTPWLDYVEDDAPTPDARVDSLPPGSSWFLAVQARDEAGAVTPTFTKRSKNLLHFVVRADMTPELRLSADHMDGIGVFEDPVNELRRKVFAQDEIGIQWNASAESYAGVITGYRWGWNVADPNDPDDPAWTGPWSLDTSAPPREIPEGGSTFTLLVRDDSENQTQVTLEFEGVDPLPAPLRPVLLVEDYGLESDTSEANAVLTEWSAAWDRVLSSQLSDYDPAIDHIVVAQGEEGPTLETIASYANVIWSLAGPYTGTWFWRERSLNGPLHYQWLWAHQRLRGGLLLAGPAAAEATLEIAPDMLFLPVDLTQPYTTPYDFPPVDLSHCWLREAWGVTVVDRVYSETRSVRPKVSYPCDGLVLARASDEALALGIGDLHPTASRIPPFENRSFYDLQYEGFYDLDLRQDSGPISSNLTQVLFRWEALRDSPWADSSMDCLPAASNGLSYLDGAATGIDRPSTPRLRPSAASAQILWGYHPMAFDEDDLSTALRGIFSQLWGLSVR